MGEPSRSHVETQGLFFKTAGPAVQAPPWLRRLDLRRLWNLRQRFDDLHINERRGCGVPFGIWHTSERRFLVSAAMFAFVPANLMWLLFKL